MEITSRNVVNPNGGNDDDNDNTKLIVAIVVPIVAVCTFLFI